MLTCRRAVGLLELFEDRLAPVGPNPGAGIVDREADAAVGRGLDHEADAAPCRELDGVSGQVGEDLSQPDRIAPHACGKVWCQQGRDLEALVLSARRQEFDDALDQRCEIEDLIGEFELSGFDAGEIENFIDQRGEGLAGALDGLDIGHLLAVERCSGQKLGNAEDPVQWGPHLVADRCKEARFRLARRFGLLTRFDGVPHFPDLVAQQFVTVAQPSDVSAQAETIERREPRHGKRACSDHPGPIQHHEVPADRKGR